MCLLLQYQVNSFKNKCIDYLLTSMTAGLATEALLIADEHGISTLKEHSLEYIRQHREQVSATKGWKDLSANREDLVKEVGAKKAKTMKKNYRDYCWDCPGSEDWSDSDERDERDAEYWYNGRSRYYH